MSKEARDGADFKFVEPHANLWPGRGQWTWRLEGKRLQVVVGCPACGMSLFVRDKDFAIGTNGDVCGGRKLQCAPKYRGCGLIRSFRLLGWREHQPRS